MSDSEQHNAVDMDQDSYESAVEISMVPPIVSTDMTAQLFAHSRLSQQQLYDIEIVGIPPDWVAPFARLMTLQADQSSQFPLMFSVPPYAQAGDYILWAKLTTDGTSTRHHLGTLHVEKHDSFSVEMHPTVIRGSGNVLVAVTNHGNSSTSFLIETHDSSGTVQFNPTNGEIDIPPFETFEGEIALRPQQLKLLGISQHHHFTVSVTNNEGESQLLEAELIAQPVVTIWTSLLFLLGIVLVLGVIGLIIFSPF